VTCHNCKKKGHYKSQCFSKLLKIALQSGKTLDAVSDERSCISWNKSLAVNGQIVIFKVDTGPEISVITEETMNRLTHDTKFERRSTTTRHKVSVHCMSDLQ
jgi:mevalonate pyrophosphate decarboxylase